MRDSIREIVGTLVIFGLVYLQENNVPIGMYVKRFVHKQTWSLAAFTQRVAIHSYREYRKEVETHG